MAIGALGEAQQPGARRDNDRVRRPADLLLAVFSFLVVAVVLGSIRALPLGSTEVADDVSALAAAHPALAVVRGGRGRRGGLLRPGRSWHWSCWLRGQWRDARNAVAAGVAGAAAAVIATVIWRIENAAVQRAVLHGSNPSTFVVDTALVAFVVGTDLSRLSHW